MKHYAVVQVRGLLDSPQKVRDTLLMIGLTRKNHCVLVDDRVSYKGMLQLAKDRITWGEVTQDNVEAMLVKRGRTEGNKKLTDDYVKKHSAYKSIKELAAALMKGETTMRDIRGLKPLFRLNSPSKGYEPTKRPWGNGGALGYRGEEINSLLKRMM
jgi:large subunit ribosomal protein L30